MLQDFLELPRPPDHVAIGSWPTPVEPLPGLARLLSTDIWIKRDDLSAIAYGGNKTRKLEFLLGEAIARCHRTLVVVGGVGSNQLVATAIHGKQLGLSTVGIVLPQPVTAAARDNVVLAVAAGAQLIPCPVAEELPHLLELALKGADSPLLVPAGGSKPAGNLGFVAAALELDRQIKSGAMPVPDDILVAAGTGGTMAGLIVGVGLLELGSRVVGVRVAGDSSVSVAIVRKQIAALKGLLRRAGARVAVPEHPEFTLIEHHFGGEYGRATPAALAALEMVRDSDQLVLEPIYTGKAMAALVEYCQGAGRGRSILFWNTCNTRDVSPLVRGATMEIVPDSVAALLTGDDQH